MNQIEKNEIAQTMSKAMSGKGITPSFTRLGKIVDVTKKAETITEPNQKKKWWQFGK